MINPKHEVERVKAIDEILSALPDAVFIYDRHGKILYSNRAAAEALGIKQADITGKTLRQLGFPSEVIETLEAGFIEVFTTGKPFATEISAAPVREVRYFEYIVEPIYRIDGGIDSILIVARDITEKKHFEEALKERDEQYRRIVETSHEGIWVLGTDVKTTFVNNRMAEMLGYTVDEMLGRSVYEFMDEEMRAKTEVERERRERGITEQVETGSCQEF